MVKSFLNKGGDYLSILILTLCILIFNTNSTNVIFIMFGIITWYIVYICTTDKRNYEFLLTRLIILSIPLSFRSIAGNLYSVSILTWFNIFLLLSLLFYLTKYTLSKMVEFNNLSKVSIVVGLISIIPTLIGGSIIGGLKQYFNIILVLSAIVIGASFKSKLSPSYNLKLKQDYIVGTLIAGVGVIIQILFLSILNIKVGNYQLFGSNRHAFGFLFSDYSFLSLYLSSGAIMVYFSKEIFQNQKKNMLGLIIFLLITSALTSARTGIFSFVIIFGIDSMFNIFTDKLKDSKKTIMIIGSNLIIIISSLTVFNRTRGNFKFNDSGRLRLNMKAFNLFLENPIFGIGFGDNNYPGMLPHNIIFQSLAQGGLFYSIPLMIFIILLLKESHKLDKGIFMTLLCIFVGSLFVPNIFSSRFIVAIVMMLSLL